MTGLTDDQRQRLQVIRPQSVQRPRVEPLCCMAGIIIRIMKELKQKGALPVYPRFRTTKLLR
jgi:hypothetical protein